MADVLTDLCEWCEDVPPVTSKANMSVCAACADDVTQCERCGLALKQSEGFASSHPSMRFDGLLHEDCAYPEEL